MTQSDPAPTPRGSGGVATGSGSPADSPTGSGGGSPAGATEVGATGPGGTGRSDRIAASAERSEPPRPRERVIPPLKPTATPPAQRSASAKESERGSQKVAERPTQGPEASQGTERASTARKVLPRPASNGSPAKTTKSAKPARPAASRPRRARLRLTQVDAWTVMKTAFLLSIALGIVSVVAVAIVWTVLGAAGVFDSLNGTVQTLLGNDFRVQDYIGTGRVLGFTMLVAVVDVVLLTAIATLGAFLYNLSATLLGGVELTLTEDG